MAKRWSKTEIAHLKRNAEKQSLEELAQRFHTDTDEVKAKMEELGLGSGSGGDEARDAALEEFEKGLEHLYASRWKKAAKGMEKVIEDADQPELVDRARQYLAICETRQQDDSEFDDPYLEAVMAKNDGDLETAEKLIEKQGKKVEKEEKFAYLMASVKALAGDADDALKLLGKAIELDRRNRVQAFHDPDFAELREREEFDELLEAPQA